MINIFKLLSRKRKVSEANQEALLDFVNNTDNIHKAAKGSMEKRLELIKRAQSQPV